MCRYILYVTQEAAYTTIQSAVNAAVNGDVIELSPGTYTGAGNRDVDFSGKAITVRSVSGPENCIIDCQSTTQNRHRGFIFHNDEDLDSVLDGVTIKHGRGQLVTVEIWDEENRMAYRQRNLMSGGSSPSIRNCILTENIDDDPESDGTIACITSFQPCD